ncbi:ABC transporter permease [Herbidospora sp. NBRC 101105]|uniref:ABC transporter permease n=1 Tax=Herbidospora sp. NBRC 101105 TaxID=3032195 RepID=UPI0024A33873|nr:ABC transporter permease [Herbidospora sp. NBRC 101105]GLX95689.1 membrane protein [Herbidospora sp. NBRC 101105]
MSQPTGVIHDIGYRHYDGPRLGRGAGAVALWVYSLRGTFGLGRTFKSKIMPFLLFGAMMLPAVVSITIMALLKQAPLSYTDYAVFMQPVIAIFLAAQSPVLVAPDLRHRVIPLYLSRPVTIVDYIGAKLAAMIAALLILMVVPLTVQFVGELLIDLPMPLHTHEYLAGLAGSLINAVLLASIGLTLASFTPRRGLGVASVIAFYMFTLAASAVLFGVLQSEGHVEAGRWGFLLNPFFLVNAVQVNLFGTQSASGEPVPGGAGPALVVVAVVLLALAALYARYRKALAA